MRYSQKVKYFLKNTIGWKTKRKIVALSVDDYGNVRVASKQARLNMDSDGLPVTNRFDYYDSLENKDDLMGLYDALSSVKDVNGNHAVFSAFSLPANIDFEAMERENYQEYRYELLPDTFSKLSGYAGVFDLWKQGITEKLIVPEFHGREHLNIKLLMFLLERRDKEVLSCFRNRSYTSITSTPFNDITYPAAFSFDKYEENSHLESVIQDGLRCFENVFGVKSQHFTSPTMSENVVLHKALREKGISYIDAPMIKTEHQGEGLYKKSFHYTGQSNSNKQRYVVRNCIFEPNSNKSIDWVAYCLEQIGYSFMLNRPANISSHRVNFCGNIDSKNREEGLAQLKQLLRGIVKLWPDVEFMSTAEMMSSLSQIRNS